jgi:hypothetical protein
MWSKVKGIRYKMIFKIIKNIMKIIIGLIFIISSPMIFLISIIHAKSFKEAYKETIEIIKEPLKY